MRLSVEILFMYLLDLYPALSRRLRAAYNKQLTERIHQSPQNLRTPTPPPITTSIPKPQHKQINPPANPNHTS